LLTQSFLAWWLTPKFATASSGAAQILIFAFWLNSLAIVPHTKLFAEGRSDLVAKCHLVELAPYLLVLYLSLKFGGVVGAAIAFALRVGVDVLLLAYFGGILGVVLRIVCIPAVLLCATLCVSLSPVLLGLRLALACTILLILLAWFAVQVRTLGTGAFKYNRPSTRSN